MSIVCLKEIDFGKTDGRSEAEQKNFLSLFYDDNYHTRKLIDDNCFIISGYKGTGKTILSNYFSKKREIENKALIRKLNSTDFIQEKLLIFSKSPITREELVIFWKYVFLREFGFLLKKRQNKSLWLRISQKNRLKVLDSLLEEANWVMTKAEDFYQTKEGCSIKAGTEASESIHSANIQAVSSGELIESSKVQKVRAEYTELIRKLEDCVYKLLGTKHEYYIIYDDMDQLDEQMNREDFLELIKQMLYASESLNQRFREGKNKCRVIHALRSDIQNLVLSKSYNLFKTTSDYGVEIDWYAERQKKPENHPLIKMILHKVRKSVDSYSSLSDRALYDTIFFREENVLNYFLNHSFGRPRELVKYFTIVQKRYPEDTKITLKMLQDCLPEYSKWFYDSLLAEISINPRIKSIMQVLNIIQLRGVRTLTSTKTERFARDKSAEIPDNLIDVLSEMYNLGILGIRTSKGMTQFHYRSNAPLIPNESTKFVVHFGLLKYLNIR